MVRTVDGDWLRSRLGEPALTVADPRPIMRYLSGHVPGAVSVPTEKAFDLDGRLLPDDALADWLGASGISNGRTVVVYGDSDGQAAAMLAWMLEYLGHPDVVFLRSRFERWKEEGGELAYRPVAATATTFEARPRAELRATWKDVASPLRCCLLDTRSPEEYQGDRVIAGDPPGHIPGALNVPWLSFLAEDDDLLLSPGELAVRLQSSGADPDQETVVYCRAALRAAVAWLAMHVAGAPVRLYDASFLDWSRRPGLPIETGATAMRPPPDS